MDILEKIDSNQGVGFTLDSLDKNDIRAATIKSV